GKICESQGIDYTYASGWLGNRTFLENDIATIKPTHVFNAAGVTDRPNVDWCELRIPQGRDHQDQCGRLVPLTLADVCWDKGLVMINYFSGCIFECDDMHPLGSGIWFKEEDTPNFTGSYYSKTKAMVNVPPLE
ncbi:unnamed protein product, partial [Linum tenue]